MWASLAVVENAVRESSKRSIRPLNLLSKLRTVLANLSDPTALRGVVVPAFRFEALSVAMRSIELEKILQTESSLLIVFRTSGLVNMHCFRQLSRKLLCVFNTSSIVD